MRTTTNAAWPFYPNNVASPEWSTVLKKEGCPSAFFCLNDRHRHCTSRKVLWLRLVAVVTGWGWMASFVAWSGLNGQPPWFESTNALNWRVKTVKDGFPVYFAAYSPNKRWTAFNCCNMQIIESDSVLAITTLSKCCQEQRKEWNRLSEVLQGPFKSAFMQLHCGNVTLPFQKPYSLCTNFFTEAHKKEGGFLPRGGIRANLHWGHNDLCLVVICDA